MSNRAQRIHHAAAYILHASAWRETSLIVQLFSRDHGCVAVVAKGAKRPYSALRPILASFQPLSVSWSGSGEVRTLTRAELAGIRQLRSHALMSAWYMNELILRLLPRDDPHPALYDAYDAALQAFEVGDPVANALRRFEWILLEETGYGLGGDVPSFSQPGEEKRWRVALRARLDELLGRPLRTRQVLLELQRYT